MPIAACASIRADEIYVKSVASGVISFKIIDKHGVPVDLLLGEARPGRRQPILPEGAEGTTFVGARDRHGWRNRLSNGAKGELMPSNPTTNRRSSTTETTSIHPLPPDPGWLPRIGHRLIPATGRKLIRQDDTIKPSVERSCKLRKPMLRTPLRVDKQVSVLRRRRADRRFEQWTHHGQHGGIDRSISRMRRPTKQIILFPQEPGDGVQIALGELLDLWPC